MYNRRRPKSNRRLHMERKAQCDTYPIHYSLAPNFSGILSFEEAALSFTVKFRSETPCEDGVLLLHLEIRANDESGEVRNVETYCRVYSYFDFMNEIIRITELMKRSILASLMSDD